MNFKLVDKEFISRTHQLIYPHSVVEDFDLISVPTTSWGVVHRATTDVDALWWSTHNYVHHFINELTTELNNEIL